MIIMVRSQGICRTYGVPVPKLPYADSGLDRGGSRRADERWISGLLGEQATVIIPMLLEEARWFTRDQARAANVGQRHDSIEHYLIEDWLSESD
jgi:hypothetical protein